MYIFRSCGWSSCTLLQGIASQKTVIIVHFMRAANLLVLP